MHKVQKPGTCKPIQNLRHLLKPVLATIKENLEDSKELFIMKVLAGFLELTTKKDKLWSPSIKFSSHMTC
jgi:hypothetical protein